MLKRTFIALPVPVSETLRQDIDTFRKSLKGAEVRWTDFSNLHLTLAFLGDSNPHQIESTKLILANTAERIRQFRIHLSYAGAFKSISNPQVLWLGMEAEKQLEILYYSIQEKIAGIGFEPDNRRFKPHITLGRIKKVAGNNLNEAMTLLSSRVNETITASKIVFFESRLTPSGPVYSPLQEYELKSPARE